MSSVLQYTHWKQCVKNMEMWQSGRLRQTVNLFLTARWFESIRLHQIWLDRIKVITSDCLSDYRGSIPRRVARLCLNLRHVY
jgi:hypothetical protein